MRCVEKSASVPGEAKWDREAFILMHALKKYSYVMYLCTFRRNSVPDSTAHLHIRNSPKTLCSFIDCSRAERERQSCEKMQELVDPKTIMLCIKILNTGVKNSQFVLNTPPPIHSANIIRVSCFLLLCDHVKRSYCHC